jgi:hypothetical protein
LIVTDNRVAEFVGGRCGVDIVPPFTCAGTERNGEIINGVVFNVFTGYDVHVTVAGNGWSKEFIRAVGRYVFDQLGCVRMTVTTNQPLVVNIAQRMGGVVEGIQRDLYGRGENGTIIGILKDEWRFK